MGTKGRRKPKAKYQKIWTYLRRNKRGVKVSDILLLVEDIKEYQLKNFFLALTKAGFTTHTNDKTFKAREYRMINCTGVVAPSLNHVKQELFDGNTGKVTSLRKKKKLSINGEEIRAGEFLKK